MLKVKENGAKEKQSKGEMRLRKIEVKEKWEKRKRGKEKER